MQHTLNVLAIRSYETQHMSGPISSYRANKRKSLAGSPWLCDLLFSCARVTITGILFALNTLGSL